MLGNNCGDLSGPEATDAVQPGSLQGEDMRNGTYLSNTGPQHRAAVRALHFVSAVSAFLSQIGRFLQSSASPRASCSQELPRAPWAGGFPSHHPHAHTCSSCCPSQPFCCHSSSLLSGGKDRADTAGSLPAGDSLPSAEQRCPAPSRQLASNSNFFSSSNGRKGAEPRLEMAVL